MKRKGTLAAALVVALFPTGYLELEKGLGIGGGCSLNASACFIQILLDAVIYTYGLDMS